MEHKSMIEKDVKEFLSQKMLKPILESLDDKQLNLLSSALFDAFAHLINKHVAWKPWTSESVHAVIQALNIISSHMKDNDLQPVLTDLIQEITVFIENNDKRIHSMELELNEQKCVINRLSMQIEETEALFLANDLGDIYIHYVFEPKYTQLLKAAGTWSMFTNEISQVEEKIRCEQLTRTLEHREPIDADEVEKEINNLYHSIQKKLKVNLPDLRSLKRDRVAIAHSQRKAVADQKKLLEKARRIVLPSNFEHKKVFYDMIDELIASDVKFHRMS